MSQPALEELKSTISVSSHDRIKSEFSTIEREKKAQVKKNDFTAFTSANWN